MSLLPLGIALNKAALFLRRIQIALNLCIPALLSPQALVAFNLRSYRQRYNRWAEEMPRLGLYPWEKELVERARIPPGGRILVLFCGGGRDAVGLAKLGFRVTAVDFVPEFIDAARRHARESGVEVEFSVQDSSQVHFPPASFDAVVVFLYMYSSVPGRARRVEMLRRVHTQLRPQGTALLSFANARLPANELRWCRLLQKGARLFGNPGYQLGDTLHANVEYSHYFQDEKEVAAEAVEAGFEGADLNLRGPGGAVAVLRRKGEAG